MLNQHCRWWRELNWKRGRLRRLEKDTHKQREKGSNLREEVESSSERGPSDSTNPIASVFDYQPKMSAINTNTRSASPKATRPIPLDVVVVVTFLILRLVSVYLKA